MTTMDERRQEFAAKDTTHPGDGGLPQSSGRTTELPAQRDDDEFAPTIVRGRE